MTDSDLWWAVLGGGGGVYGIVTQFVLKLHSPPDGFVQFFTKFPIEDSGNCAGVATQVVMPYRIFEFLRHLDYRKT